MIELDQLARQLLGASHLLLTTHRNPDGDGLGCLLALRDVLRAANRRVTLLTPGAMPARFAFLPGAAEVRNWYHIPAAEQAALLAAHDLVLVVDTHELYMLDTLGTALREADLPCRFLDHHPMRRSSAANRFVDPAMSSTGELSFHLVQDLQATPMSARAATCLYVAIAYDTNFFKYLRGRAATLRVAASLIDLGADTDEIYRQAFASHTAAKIALTRDLLQRFQLAEGGRVAFASINGDLIASTQAQPDDMRDLITLLLEMDGVEIAITFKERGDGRQKVSLRSKGRYPLENVTTALGGGGHAFASGAHVQGSLDEATARVLGLVRELLGSTPARD